MVSATLAPPIFSITFGSFSLTVIADNIRIKTGIKRNQSNTRLLFLEIRSFSFK